MCLWACFADTFADGRPNIRSELCCDYDKRTPMHVAAQNGAYIVTEWLVQHGASVNAIDAFSLTPLACAVRAKHKQVVQLLQVSVQTSHHS